MQTFETSLHYRLVCLGDSDPLTKPITFVHYMRGAFVDCANKDSFWLISMNPKHRPISRTLLRSGPMAGGKTLSRDLFKVALLAGAYAIAAVRGEPGEDVTMDQHDHRLVKHLCDTADRLGIEFVDFLIVSTSDDLQCPIFHSWNAAGRR